MRLGGPKVRRAWTNFADSQEGSDVSLYQDVSTAPLFDLRRRLKAVVDLLSAMIRCGVSLARSVELAVQWDGIGPFIPFLLMIFLLAWGEDLGQCCQVVQGLHRRLSDFIHGVVVHRMEEAIRGWRGCLREDPFVHPYKWLRPELVPLALVFQCDPALSPGCSGVLAVPLWFVVEFLLFGFLFSVFLDEGRPSLRNSLLKLWAGCLFLWWSCLGFL